MKSHVHTECVRLITQAEKDWWWGQIMLAAIRKTQERIDHARQELYNSLDVTRMLGAAEELEDLRPPHEEEESYDA